MSNNEKLKVVFDFIYYYLSEDNTNNNIKHKTTSESDSVEYDSGVNLNHLINVERANELIKTIQHRDTFNANINKIKSDYENKLKDSFSNLKKEFQEELKSYNDEDEINEDNTINDNVILDNGEVVVTSKPIKSVLQTTKKSTNKKN